MVIKPPRKSGRLERRSIDVKNKIHLMEKYIVKGSQLRPGVVILSFRKKLDEKQNN